MPSARGIRAGRAFVELFADDSKLVRGLGRVEKRLKAFGDRIRNLVFKLAGLAGGSRGCGDKATSGRLPPPMPALADDFGKPSGWRPNGPKISSKIIQMRE